MRPSDPPRDPDGTLRRLFVRAAREILDGSDTALELRKVAERAGKSRTAPYLAFGKAEDGGGLPALQMAVASDGFLELEQELRKAMGEAGSPEEALERVAAAYLAFARGHPRLFRHMFGHEVSRALREPPGCAPAAREQRELLEARVRLEWTIGRLVQAQHPAHLREVPGEDPATVAAALWAMIHGVAVLTIDEQWGLGELGEEDARRQAERALRFLTTASHRAVREAARALDRARARKSAGELGPGVFASRIHRPMAPERIKPAEPKLDADGFSLHEASALYHRSSVDPAAHEDPLLAPVLRRVGARAERLRGVRVLWIDDHPRGVAHERRMLEALGMKVVAVESSQRAFELLDRSQPELVISDVARGPVEDEGIRVLPALRALAPSARVIFYVNELDEEAPVPAGAFGITNDPDELLHLVMDAVERG